MARRQLEVSNDVAASLAGSQDRMLRELEQHLDTDVFLRGNVLTLDGDAEAVAHAATVVRELSTLVERGHEVNVATLESVTRVLDQAQSPSSVLEDVVWKHRNLRVAPKSVNQKRYVDAIREHRDLRHRPGRHRQDVPGHRHGRRRAVAARGQPHHPHPPGRRGRRAPRLPAGRPHGEGRPVPAAALRRAARHARPERVTAHLEKGVIEVAPLAFMRGRTLNDSFVILDEAQNTSPEQMKMFLTRLGFGSKMVVNGDVSQIDLPREQRSGLVEVGDILRDVEDVSFVRFGGEDVVRHKLVQRIVAAYASTTRGGDRAADRAPAPRCLSSTSRSSATPSTTPPSTGSSRSRSPRRESRRGTSRCSSSTRPGSRSSTRSTVTRRSRPTSFRSRSTSWATPTASASSATW
jgi:phosphate starvation-inducible PhoH-like protein